MLAVGIMAPSPGVLEPLVREVEATQLASIKVVSDFLCAREDDEPSQRFIEAHPDVVLVDVQCPAAGVKALCTLHAVLPQTWLIAFAGSGDPQLVIDSMQAGAREFLPGPLSARMLAGALERSVNEKIPVPTVGKPRGAIYSVIAAKGGAGSTSVAVNLAAALAGVPELRIALLDLDRPDGDAASHLHVKPHFSIGDALAAPILDAEQLETFMTRVGGLSLLAEPEEFKTKSPVSCPALDRLLRVASETYTHVFLDLPSTLSQDLLKVATGLSTAVLVVMTPELPTIWRAHRLLVLLEDSGCRDRLRVILNRYDKRDYLPVREWISALGHPINWRLPNDYGTVIRAIGRGRPVVEMRYSRLASAYRKLAEDLTGVVPRKPHRALIRIVLGRRPAPVAGKPN